MAPTDTPPEERTYAAVIDTPEKLKARLDAAQQTGVLDLENCKITVSFGLEQLKPYCTEESHPQKANCQVLSYSYKVLAQGAYFKAVSLFEMKDKNFIIVNFEKETDFILTTFEEEAYFGRTTFKEKSYFTGATFQGEASFALASFEEKVDFENAIFENTAHFQKAFFKDNVDFESCIFQNETNFSDATFLTEENGNRSAFINFRDSIFEGETDFSNTTFQDMLVFTKANFKKEANFTKASFQYTHFECVNFDAEAYFGGVNFNSGVNFDRACFHKNVVFNGANFFDQLSYQSTVFFQTALFLEVSLFSGIESKRHACLYFSNLNLQSSTQLRLGVAGAEKGAIVKFEGLQTGGTQRFMHIDGPTHQTPWHLIFEDCRFFGDNIALADADMRQVRIYRGHWYQGIVFIHCHHWPVIRADRLWLFAPAYSAVHPPLERRLERPGDFAADWSARYARLKVMATDQGETRLASAFYFWQQYYQWMADGCHWFSISGVYLWLSAYGLSWRRPLCWWALVWLLCGVVYDGLLGLWHGWWAWDALKGLEISFLASFPPIAPLMVPADLLKDSLASTAPWIVALFYLLAAVQLLVQGFLLFQIGAAIRNQVKR